MSGYTDNLNLFKYNTTTDGANKFNIDLALNDNFDKIDTFAGSVNTSLNTKQNTSTAVKHEQNTAYGTVIKPVYVDANGNVQECTKTIEDARFDGQWVSDYKILSTSGAIGSFQASLATYLPNDSYNYLCQFSVNFYDYGQDSGLMYFETDIYQQNNVTTKNKLYVSQGNQYARHNANIFMLPVGTGRYIKWYCTNDNTSREVAVAGYRRLGTNQ